MTATYPSPHHSCTHHHAIEGLDSCYCPDCKKSFAAGTAGYKEIVERCNHKWIVTWLEDGKLGNFCVICALESLVSDRHVLEQWRQEATVALAQYEQILKNCKSEGRRKDFARAIATKKRQIAWIESVVADSEHSLVEHAGGTGQHPCYKLTSHQTTETLQPHTATEQPEGNDQPDVVLQPHSSEHNSHSSEHYEIDNSQPSYPNPQSPSNTSISNKLLGGTTKTLDLTELTPPSKASTSNELLGGTDTSPDTSTSNELLGGTAKTLAQLTEPIPPSKALISNDLSDEAIPPSKTRRQKGLGTGYLESKPIIRNNQEYPQHWYHYEEWSKGDRLVKKTKYIPKRLVAKIQELDSKKVPVREILDLLGVQK